MTIQDIVGRLPAPTDLRRLSQSLALLDAVLCEELASMNNGSGDEYAIVFDGDEAFIRGFDHESDLSPYARSPIEVHLGVLRNLPARFQALVTEPAFQGEGTFMASMACWWEKAGPWRCGDPPSDASDGSDWMLEQLLDGTPASYVAFAAEYFEIDPDPDVVAAIYAHEPLSIEQARTLDPLIIADRLRTEIERIGYRR